MHNARYISRHRRCSHDHNNPTLPSHPFRTFSYHPVPQALLTALARQPATQHRALLCRPAALLPPPQVGTRVRSRCCVPAAILLPPPPRPPPLLLPPLLPLPAQPNTLGQRRGKAVDDCTAKVLVLGPLTYRPRSNTHKPPGQRQQSPGLQPATAWPCTATPSRQPSCSVVQILLRAPPLGCCCWPALPSQGLPRTAEVEVPATVWVGSEEQRQCANATWGQ